MIHYDVEKTMARMRETVAERELPADAPLAVRIVHRNRQITLAFMEMCLSEANQGTSEAEVIFASANFVAEFLTNFCRRHPEATQVRILEAFEAQLNFCLEQCLTGSALSYGNEIVREAGGHA